MKAGVVGFSADAPAFRDFQQPPERIDAFFERLHPLRAQLPAYRGELYFEYHRGTYTTHSDIKVGLRARPSAPPRPGRPHAACAAWNPSTRRTGNGSSSRSSTTTFRAARFMRSMTKPARSCGNSLREPPNTAWKFFPNRTPAQQSASSMRCHSRFSSSVEAAHTSCPRFPYQSLAI